MKPGAYGQWRAWMAILAHLRSKFPDIVMDHRQTAHKWGPWYHLAGSYAEPIAGDENPETYGVPIASLHTDHVAADNTRIINYKYAALQLLPPSRVPGFIFHQTERTADNGTNPCFGGSALCFDNNTRDFDLLGYRYSLLSTVGTAGLNNVVTMIPARDPVEFSLFPKEDRDFIHSWLSWTDAHAAYLANTAPIATLPPPGLGVVDGTSAMLSDEGFVFLFNPSLRQLSVNISIDESLGISNGSAARMFQIEQLYPRRMALGNWSHSSLLTLTLEGSSAMVLSLSPSLSPPEGSSANGPSLSNRPNTAARSGVVSIAGLTGRLHLRPATPHSSVPRPTTILEWEGAEGLPGTTTVASISRPFAAEATQGVRINGVDCTLYGAPAAGGAAPRTLSVTFTAGPIVQHAQPLGPLPPPSNVRIHGMRTLMPE